MAFLFVIENLRRFEHNDFETGPLLEDLHASVSGDYIHMILTNSRLNGV